MQGFIIKPADNTLGLVIMLESDYRACVQANVPDATVYTKITPAVAQHVTAARDKLQLLIDKYSAPLDGCPLISVKLWLISFKWL
jgi:hypothetical protein